MILNINSKIIIVIAFFSTVTSLASLSSVAVASIDYSDTAIEESKCLLQLQVWKEIVEKN